MIQHYYIYLKFNNWFHVVVIPVTHRFLLLESLNYQYFLLYFIILIPNRQHHHFLIPNSYFFL